MPHLPEPRIESRTTSNSKKPTIGNDVATYLGATNEWITNSNGALPTTAAHVTAINNLANTATGTTKPTTVTALASPSGTATNAVALNTIALYTNARCNGADAAYSAGRSFVVLYSVEGSNGTPVYQCQAG